MCSIDYDYAVTVLTDQSRTARKDHKCGECGRLIKKGEKYRYISFTGDEFGYSKACAHCEQARHWLNKHCGGWKFGGLHEELTEHFFDGYTEDFLGRLVVSIRRGWKKFKSDELMEIPNIFWMPSHE